MARIRSLKPEIWQDEALGRCPLEARLLFVGMITQADDEGRLRAAPALLRSAVFPYDSVTPARVSEWLASLREASLVVVYEANGETFCHLRGWKNQKVDHPTPSKLPPPPEPNREDSRGFASVPGRLAPDQGSRKGSGIKDQGDRASAVEAEKAIFEHWIQQPNLIKHRSQTPGITRAIRKALKDADADNIREAIGLYAQVLESDAHYWTMTWTIEEFLQRGLSRFTPETAPLVRFLKTNQTSAPNGRAALTQADRVEAALRTMASIEEAQGRPAAVDWLENVHSPSTIEAVKARLT